MEGADGTQPRWPVGDDHEGKLVDSDITGVRLSLREARFAGIAPTDRRHSDARPRRDIGHASPGPQGHTRRPARVATSTTSRSDESRAKATAISSSPPSASRSAPTSGPMRNARSSRRWGIGSSGCRRHVGTPLIDDRSGHGGPPRSIHRERRPTVTREAGAPTYHGYPRPSPASAYHASGFAQRGGLSNPGVIVRPWSTSASTNQRENDDGQPDRAFRDPVR